MHTTIAARANLELIDQNYARWQEDPASVDPSWVAFFEGFELGNLPQKNGAASAAPRAATRESPLQTRIDGLVYAYRTLGHTIARVNPLAEKRPENPLLSLRELGFNEKDLDLPCVNGSRIVRRFSPFALRWTKAFFASGRGVADGDPGQHSSQVFDGWRGRDLHGDGAPRPAQCARELFEEIAPRHLYRV